MLCLRLQARQRGFEGVHSNPHFDLQKNINTPLNCTFLVSYHLKVVLAAIEKVTAVQTCLRGCSYASLFTGDQRRTLARSRRLFIVSCPDYFSHAEGKNSLVQTHVRGAPIRLLHANDVTYATDGDQRWLGS